MTTSCAPNANRAHVGAASRAACRDMRICLLVVVFIGMARSARLLSGSVAMAPVTRRRSQVGTRHGLLLTRGFSRTRWSL